MHDDRLHFGANPEVQQPTEDIDQKNSFLYPAFSSDDTFDICHRYELIGTNGIMGDFFHRWQRKIGVVVLILALVFMGGWVRSFVVADGIHILNDDFFSVSGGLFWQRTLSKNANRSISFTSWEDFDPLFDYDKWGFGFGAGGDETNLFSSKTGGIVGVVKTTFYRVPYWFIAMPLTLLSAYLLVIAPRSANIKTPTMTVRGMETTASDFGEI